MPGPTALSASAGFMAASMPFHDHGVRLSVMLKPGPFASCSTRRASTSPSIGKSISPHWCCKIWWRNDFKASLWLSHCVTFPACSRTMSAICVAAIAGDQPTTAGQQASGGHNWPTTVKRAFQTAAKK